LEEDEESSFDGKQESKEVDIMVEGVRGRAIDRGSRLLSDEVDSLMVVIVIVIDVSRRRSAPERLGSAGLEDLLGMVIVS
jgi:hypothetical protein